MSLEVRKSKVWGDAYGKCLFGCGDSEESQGNKDIRSKMQYIEDTELKRV